MSAAEEALAALEAATRALGAQRAALLVGDRAALDAAHAQLEAAIAELDRTRAACRELEPLARQRLGKRLRAQARENAKLLVRGRDLIAAASAALPRARLDRRM